MHIRPAEVKDNAFAIEMIYETMGSFADELFGLGDHDLALVKLSSFYCSPGNHFSYQTTKILEIDGQPAGLLQAMTGKELQRLIMPMLSQTRKMYSFPDLFRVMWRSLPLLFEKEAEPDEYYIQSLAVHRDYRRRGLREALIRHAEMTAPQPRFA